MPGRFLYPRPEYPRPDFQRGKIEGEDWLNLNGPWQFRFDPDRLGLDEGWHLPNALDWRDQILVPFCWESLAAWGEAETAGNENYYSTRAFRNPLEVNRANHSYVARHEVGWYRRRLRLPAHPAWKNKRIILKIGAADFITDAWCNGFHVGRHEGGYTPFEFDLTEAVARGESNAKAPAGDALLILRVEDPMDNTEQPVGKQWHWYTSTSGIWQTVYLEPRELEHIDSFRITTDIDEETVSFAVQCNNATAPSEITINVFSPDDEVLYAKTAVTNGLAATTLKIHNAQIWSPEHPNLYRVVFQLHSAGQTRDEVRSYFGLRKIDSGPSEDPNAPAVLRLNNNPIYLRGALYQSYHPDGVYTAVEIDTLEEDILSAKKFGFNFLRVHIKIDDPLLLYFADSLGLLLMCDFPNFGEGGNTPLGRRRFEEMMRAAIRRDFNHPSIIAWCVFNETWGFGGQVELIKHFPNMKEKTLPKKVAAPKPATPGEVAPPPPPPAAPVAAEATQKKIANLEAHAWVQQMWELTKKLDPTRLVEDMSVVPWEHLDYYGHGNTDINSWHFYIDDYYKAKEHIENVVRATVSGSSFNYVPGFQQQSQPLINSEYGGVGALDGNRDCSWTFKFLTNELRRHGQISAYIYTELHDVEWEYNGFLNYDRTPKEFGYDPRLVNQSDTLPINFPPISRHVPGATVTVEVASSHFSPRAQKGVLLRWRFGGMDSWGRVHQDLALGSAPIVFPHQRVAPAHTIELKLPEMTLLGRLWVEAVSPEGKVLAANYVEFFTSAGALPHREETERSLVLRAFPHEWAEAQWSGPIHPRERSQLCCFGHGHGFFDWHFPLDGIDLQRAKKLRFLCEASARRVDTPQTNANRYPTSLHVFLNDVQIHQQILFNHPHDARGALSYLHNPFGSYGYLAAATIDGENLQGIVRNIRDNRLHLRCAVPAEELAVGGLSIYGADYGRYPIPLHLIVEW